MKVCAFHKCKDYNNRRDTHMVVVDRLGHNWFCPHHWKFIAFLFNRVVRDCINDDEGCERNHKAEIDKSERFMHTVKFQDRFYNLCDVHLATYDDLLGIENFIPDWGD